MSYDIPLSARADIGMAAARQRQPLPAAPPRERERIIVSGVVASPDGYCAWDIATGDTSEDGTLRARRHRIWRHDPPEAYAAEQPARIPVLIDHRAGQEVGEVLHLERRHGQLYAVAEVDLDYEDVQGMDLRWSSGTVGTTRPLRIRELSLTAEPASVGLPPVKFCPEPTLTRAIAHPGNRPLLQGAIEARKRRTSGDPLWIYDHDAPDIAEADADVLLERSSVAVDHISTTERIVEVLAVPYDVEAEVYWRGEWWSEVFSAGAFADFIRTGTLPRVNREHTKGDTVGKIIELREAAEGLIATVKIARTARGDDTLALAQEGMISASIGFSFLPGGRVVDRVNRHIRVLRAKLDHLSLVESPAYQGAQVLAVRRVS
jgi:HK97 family phage prohead protease